MLKKIESFYFYFILNTVNVFLSSTHFFRLKRLLLNSIGIRVGAGTNVVGPLKIGRIAKLEFGENCWIGTNFTVHGNGKVVIGNNCDLAPDITILTGSHQMGNKERRAGKGLTFDYKIGNGTWIGAKTTIINGSVIGNGVVVGACSLVTKICEDNSLYLGIPAKMVKKLDIS